jgi:N-acetylglutamate synthase-like GNAT family acetyltransferase
MEYRIATQNDVQGIQELCDKYGIAFPHRNEITFVAEHEGKIIGICGIQKRIFIEPLIAENPIAGLKLSNMVEGVLRFNGVKDVFGIVDDINEKHKGHLVKEGFGVIGENQTLFHKEL